jgi:nucleoside phosphorylase
MGPSKAAVVADRLIQQFNPTTIVNIGIAGSMEDGVLVGDVIVAEQTDAYLESSKAVENAGHNGFDFKLSGDPYKSSPDYIAHARNLEFAYPMSAQNWANICAQSLEDLIDESIRSKLFSKGLARQKPQIYIGNIASGSIVGGTSFFVNWLKNSRDRKYLALEMESAGVMTAAHTRSISTLIIRGISDYCDKRKKSLDRIGNGGLRRYAMGNAIALFWVLMDLQLIRHR